jgi:hypothetical protein
MDPKKRESPAADGMGGEDAERERSRYGAYQHGNVNQILHWSSWSPDE